MTPEELAAEFPLGPDSLPQPGVPQGRLEKFTWAMSRVFPGTMRDCWIYVPAQYDAAKPACVLVVQDGEAHWQPERRWRIPTILDNLIHQGAIPVTIGIFINPGVIPPSKPGAAERINRSFEYDSLGDRYARFVLEEILPSGDRRVVAQDVGCPVAVRVLPDQSQLIVTDAVASVAYFLTILPDGGLANGSPFYQFIPPSDEATARASGSLAASVHGWTVFATASGLQFADKFGLIAGIILPKWGKRVDGVALGGTDQTQLYMTDGRCLYRRKIRNAENLWC